MVNSKEILTCLIFIAIGYLIAKILSRMCSCGNGFRVGGMPDNLLSELDAYENYPQYSQTALSIIDRLKDDYTNREIAKELYEDITNKIEKNRDNTSVRELELLMLLERNYDLSTLKNLRHFQFFEQERGVSTVTKDDGDTWDGCWKWIRNPGSSYEEEMCLHSASDDKSDRCWEWAHLDKRKHCAIRPQYMYEKCPKSCRYVETFYTRPYNKDNSPTVNESFIDEVGKNHWDYDFDYLGG